MRIYDGLLLTYKRKEIGLSVEMWMDLDCHTELSKSEREKQISYINTYMRNLKKNGIDEPSSRAGIQTQT